MQATGRQQLRTGAAFWRLATLFLAWTRRVAEHLRRGGCRRRRRARRGRGRWCGGGRTSPRRGGSGRDRAPDHDGTQLLAHEVGRVVAVVAGELRRPALQPAEEG